MLFRVECSVPPSGRQSAGPVALLEQHSTLELSADTSLELTRKLRMHVGREIKQLYVQTQEPDGSLTWADDAVDAVDWESHATRGGSNQNEARIEIK